MRTMKKNIRWALVAYDVIILFVAQAMLLVVYKNNKNLSNFDTVIQCALSFGCIFTARFLGKIYQQIWRYGGIQSYIRLLAIDGCAFMANFIIEAFLPINHITFSTLLAIVCINLLGCLAIRMVYRYAYIYGSIGGDYGNFLNALLKIFAGVNAQAQSKRNEESSKISIAIVGAGRVGTSLSEELMNSEGSYYLPRCFVDINKDKVGRTIHGVPVLPDDETTFDRLKQIGVQEIVLALPNLDAEDKKRLYYYYFNAGYKVKVYDYPVMQNAEEKRSLRDIDIEELLFRKK